MIDWHHVVSFSLRRLCYSQCVTDGINRHTTSICTLSYRIHPVAFSNDPSCKKSLLKCLHFVIYFWDRIYIFFELRFDRVLNPKDGGTGSLEKLLFTYKPPRCKNQRTATWIATVVIKLCNSTCSKVCGRFCNVAYRILVKRSDDLMIRCATYKFTVQYISFSSKQHDVLHNILGRSYTFAVLNSLINLSFCSWQHFLTLPSLIVGKSKKLKSKIFFNYAIQSKNEMKSQLMFLCSFSINF
jgi:hypothetical protein